uniref:(northern house mosquito) hypothetical protein n=1 Tax=Culex pipiens TaxID=7175 RepID=A0A8D8MYI0_CULPI
MPPRMLPKNRGTIKISVALRRSGKKNLQYQQFIKKKFCGKVSGDFLVSQLNGNRKLKFKPFRPNFSPSLKNQIIVESLRSGDDFYRKRNRSSNRSRVAPCGNEVDSSIFGTGMSSA